VKGTLSLVCSTADFEAFLIVFSLFISTTSKRVFQTGRALAGITAYYAGSVHYWNRNLSYLSPLCTDSFALTSL